MRILILVLQAGFHFEGLGHAFHGSLVSLDSLRPLVSRHSPWEKTSKKAMTGCGRVPGARLPSVILASAKSFLKIMSTISQTTLPKVSSLVFLGGTPQLARPRVAPALLPSTSLITKLLSALLITIASLEALAPPRALMELTPMQVLPPAMPALEASSAMLMEHSLSVLRANIPALIKALAKPALLVSSASRARAIPEMNGSLVRAATTVLSMFLLAQSSSKLALPATSESWKEPSHSIKAVISAQLDIYALRELSTISGTLAPPTTTARLELRRPDAVPLVLPTWGSGLSVATNVSISLLATTSQKKGTLKFVHPGTSVLAGQRLPTSVLRELIIKKRELRSTVHVPSALQDFYVVEARF